MNEMNLPSNKVLTSIKEDQELRPFFIEYIGENLKMSLGSFYSVNKPEAWKFKKAASKSLICLMRQLEGRVEEEYLYNTIEEVCNYYMQFMTVTGSNIFHITD